MSRGRLTVVGTGPGPGYLSGSGQASVRAAEVFVGGEAALAAAPAWGERLVVRGDLAGLMEQVGRHLAAGRDVCILTSGDPGYFSLLAQVERAFPGEAVVEPGISSMQLLAARVGVPWQDLAHFSVHGRPLAFAPPAVGPFAVLTGGKHGPGAVAEYLVGLGLTARIAVGVGLGRPDEEVTVWSLAEAAGRAFGAPAAVIVAPEAWLESGGWSVTPRRPRAADRASAESGDRFVPGIPDEDFLREDKVPLSRWEVRAALASVARPRGRRVVWDVGAGSGGFAVELALLAPDARVLAFERDPAGCRVTAANAERFGARVEVVEGAAPAVLGEATGQPDLCVVGGSGGRLEEVLAVVAERLTPGGRVVVTAVTLGTLGTATCVLQAAPWVGFDALQLSSARLDPTGIMRGTNPITLFWADKGPAAAKEAL